MQPIVIALLVLAAVATLYILLRGIIGLAQGNVTPQRSQDLMRKRVLFQGLAVLLAVLLLLMMSR